MQTHLRSCTALRVALGFCEHGWQDRHVVIFHQHAYVGFDDMVVVGQGEPLGLHIVCRLAKMAHGLAHSLHHLHGDIATGSRNLLVEIDEAQDLFGGVGRRHRLLQVSAHVEEGHSQSDFVILHMLKQVLPRAMANVDREHEAGVEQVA